LAHVLRFIRDRRPDLGAREVAAPAPEPPPAPAPAGDLVQEKVLEIVAEKTGYPKEMLDLELDLEADLGIDTVKQAEMFASVREAFHLPREENLKLRDLPTLGHVIQFARTRMAGTETLAEARPAPPAALISLDAANRVPRRVPAPNLRPPLALCKATGVTLGLGARVVIMPDRGGVAEALAEELHTKGVDVLRIDPALDANALTACLYQWRAGGPVQGVYWLPALDNEGSLREMDPAGWHEGLRLRLKSLFTTMRTLYPEIGGPGAFLVSATRLGGRHGYDEAGAFAPLGGAVTGFTKTYKRERTDALVKAIDFSADRAAPEVAAILIEETLRDPAAVEIGYQKGNRWTIGLREQPAADGRPGMTLNKDTVFLITGAAGSIVSAITVDLAAASGGTFYLLDLVPEPDRANPDLKRLVSDKEGLKRDLFARIQARGERATPALVEKQLAALERAQAARSAIDAVQSAGGTAYYFSVDVTDANAVAKVIDQVRARSGRIDVLLHAAGMERSHFLPDKDPREFDLVFDVKSDGWFNILHAIGDMPLGATVAFSSIAGRFGNGGQSDYSAANDLLCKITSSFRTTRPATRGIAIDWTAWGGIGMASRGSIPKMMELAGIEMLPPEAGIPLIRRELTAGGTRGEVVIGLGLGALMDEWDATGGLDTAASGAPGPMIGKIAGVGVQHGLTIETTLDPGMQPFLHDHQIGGTPVLPGVMSLEALAEASLSILPGWGVEAVEDVNYLAPFKFYRNDPRTLTIRAMLRPDGETVVADCRIDGQRLLPNQAEPQTTTHSTARVRLTNSASAKQVSQHPGEPAGAVVEAVDIYRVYFHGPAYQVLERAWWDGNRMVGQMARDLPNNHYPSELPAVMAPRLIELCFQTAGICEMSVQHRLGLPLHIDRVRVWQAPEALEGPLFAVVTPHPAEASFDAEIVDAAGNRYVQLIGYRTVALPDAIAAEPLKAIQAVMHEEAALTGVAIS
jgi:NAD(P)-dependent dehydrogenase (short-subunit alcohol dehydrogenase family)